MAERSDATPWIAVDDPSDPRIDVFLGLRDRVLRQRRRDGLFIAEGDIVISRALAAGYRLVSILVDAKRNRPLPAAILTTAPVYAASDAVLEEIAGFNQYRGAMACFERRALPAVEAILGDPTIRSVLVAEGIVNPTNLGVTLRSAAALGIDAILVDPTSVDPLSRRCCRVSMGEAFPLPHCRIGPLPASLLPLKAAGFATMALTPAPDAESIAELTLVADERVALILGAEGAGLTEATMAAADRRLAIPMSGSVDSLNAGAAAAIAFYALDQAWRPE